MSAECTICYKYTELISLECDHEFCVNCIQEYIKVKVDDDETEITCPNEDCQYRISHQKINDIIEYDETLCEKFNEKYIEHERINAYICPKCNKSCNKKTSNYHILCPNCNCEFCHVCKNNHNYDRRDNNCPDEREIEIEFSDICAALQDIELKKCPLCKIVIEKIEGCNSIRCKHCKIKFCWECLALCSEIKNMSEHNCGNYDGYINTGSDGEYTSGDELYDDLT